MIFVHSHRHTVLRAQMQSQEEEEETKKNSDQTHRVESENFYGNELRKHVPDSPSHEQKKKTKDIDDQK